MKIRLEVGEPRDFNAGDGSKVIICTVVEGMEGSRVIDMPPTVAAKISMAAGTAKKEEKVTEWWFVCTCPPISHEGTTIQNLLMVPRYKTKRSPLDMLRDGERMVTHCVWRQDGGPWDAKTIADAQDGKIELGGMLVASAQYMEE